MFFFCCLKTSKNSELLLISFLVKYSTFLTIPKLFLGKEGRKKKENLSCFLKFQKIRCLRKFSPATTSKLHIFNAFQHNWSLMLMKSSDQLQLLATLLCVLDAVSLSEELIREDLLFQSEITRSCAMFWKKHYDYFIEILLSFWAYFFCSLFPFSCRLATFYEQSPGRSTYSFWNLSDVAVPITNKITILTRREGRGRVSEGEQLPVTESGNDSFMNQSP